MKLRQLALFPAASLLFAFTLGAQTSSLEGDVKAEDGDAAQRRSGQDRAQGH